MWFSYLKKNSKVNYFLIFLALELLSWLAYNFIPLAGIVLVIVGALTTYLVIKKPIFALYIPIAELFWGSMGHSFDYGPIGLRLLIFVMVFFAWIIRSILRKKILDLSNRLFLLWFFILFLIFASLVNAYLSGHNIHDIFLDANAYFYLLYLPIWWQVFDKKYLNNIVDILLVAALLVSIKTFWLFNLFGQDYSFVNIELIYKWVRDTRTGEITLLSGNLYRVFMQSQIYILVAWIVLFYRQIKECKINSNIAMLILYSSALLISMSRSYWLGLIFAALVLLVFLYKRINWKLILSFLYILLGSFLLIYFLSSFPTPHSSLGGGQERLDSGGAAVSSRQQLLSPMLEEIKNRPILGHGFGKTISYYSSDPRIKNDENPSGFYTTFAFEWGWLDQYIKLGIFFILSFVFWLIMLYNRVYQLAQKDKRYLILAAILSGFIVIHIFSPYLNHPLGLGAIMLISIILYNDEPR